MHELALGASSQLPHIQASTICLIQQGYIPSFSLTFVNPSNSRIFGHSGDRVEHLITCCFSLACGVGCGDVVGLADHGSALFLRERREFDQRRVGPGIVFPLGARQCLLEAEQRVVRWRQSLHQRRGWQFPFGDFVIDGGCCCRSAGSLLLRRLTRACEFICGGWLVDRIRGGQWWRDRAVIYAAVDYAWCMCKRGCGGEIEGTRAAAG